MEYPVYLEQRYMSNGQIRVKLMGAEEASKYGYEDGYHRKNAGGCVAIYVDGFDSEAAARNYFSDLNNAILLTAET